MDRWIVNRWIVYLNIAQPELHGVTRIKCVESFKLVILESIIFILIFLRQSILPSHSHILISHVFIQL